MDCHVVGTAVACLLLASGYDHALAEPRQRVPQAPLATPVGGAPCGGAGGLVCVNHTECLDDSSDDCSPERDGSDCPGVCAPFCGGLAGFRCAPGYQCVDDAADSCDPEQGAADCPGICVREPDCSAYPIILEPDPSAQAAAERELQRLSPGATMTWSPARGTFWIITLRARLDQCADGDDIFTHLFELTQAFPRLFQLNRAEWERPLPSRCGEVDASGKILQIRRVAIGAHPIDTHDFVHFSVARVGSAVELRTLVAEYLPPATSSLEQSMSACPELDQNRAREVVGDSQFTFTIFDPQGICAPRGRGLYAPNSLDTVSFGAPASWLWQEDPNTPQVLLTKANPGLLMVDRQNYSRELLASDANCGSHGVGFELTFDAVTTRLRHSKPGPGCIVCLR